MANRLLRSFLMASLPLQRESVGSRWLMADPLSGLLQDDGKEHASFRSAGANEALVDDDTIPREANLEQHCLNLLLPSALSTRPSVRTLMSPQRRVSKRCSREAPQMTLTLR